mmetsp:Transcript_20251/g.57268  ORF Transcript_20251/g.57268 Transcript_20251/m.57268 type:complete len:102 (-) Transcript_20251:112-417(-)
MATPLEDEDPDPLALSVGSALHGAGRCTPCKFFVRSGGCYYGVDCSFCHFNHKKNRVRPPKAVRKACKKLVGEGRAAEADLETLGNGVVYLRSLLKYETPR